MVRAVELCSYASTLILTEGNESLAIRREKGRRFPELHPTWDAQYVASFAR